MTVVSIRRLAGVGLRLLVATQALLAARVGVRLARTAQGVRIARDGTPTPPTGQTAERVVVLVPVLQEAERVRPCLRGVMAQGASLQQVLVVDGGSTDGTQSIVRQAAERDLRLRLLDASPLPAGVNGKAWGLQVALGAADPTLPWVLVLDADGRPDPDLVPSLIAHAQRLGLDALSVATRQEIVGGLQGVLHPSMLTTLVYRYGIPGSATSNEHEVQANGQCLLVRREVLLAAGGFAAVANEITEDVTLARLLAQRGTTVGFYESDDLVAVQMHADWRTTWRDWPRSLALRDRFWGWRTHLRLAEMTVVQGLALPLLALGLARRTTWPRWMLVTVISVAGMRLGVLAGTARAYRRLPWTYWLSPLADLPVACAVIAGGLRSEHEWRGRVVRRGSGRKQRNADPGSRAHRQAAQTSTTEHPLTPATTPTVGRSGPGGATAGTGSEAAHA